MPPRDEVSELTVAIKYFIYLMIFIAIINIIFIPISTASTIIGTPATLLTLFIAYIARRRGGFKASMRASVSLGFLLALLDLAMNTDVSFPILIEEAAKNFISYPIMTGLLGLEVNILALTYEKRHDIALKINKMLGLPVPIITHPPKPPKQPEPQPILDVKMLNLKILERKMKPGEIVPVVLQLKNNSFITVNTKVELWLTKQNFSKLLDIIPVRPLHPGEVLEKETHIKLPEGIGRGSYHIKAVVKTSQVDVERVLDEKIFRKVVEVLSPIEEILGRVINKPIEVVSPAAPTVKSIHEQVMIEDYRVVGLLGYGSFSYTFLTVDEKDNKYYVLKVPVDYGVNLLLGKKTIETIEVSKEFLREVEILSRLRTLNHPHIIKYYGTLKSIPALVFEYCSNGSLAMILKETRLPMEQALTIAIQIADALINAYEKAKLIAHRDLKPSNILFTGERILRVTDFNVSKIMSTVSRSQSLVGTYGYSAPEQFNPRLGEVSERSDVFALAVILYEMITGENPLIKLMNEYNIEYEEAVKRVHWRIHIREHKGETLRQIEKLIREATRLKPSHRLTMREFRERLTEIIQLT